MGDGNPLELDERLGRAQRGVPNPVALDRQIARADANYGHWLRALPVDPACENDPLAGERAVAGRTACADLEQLGEADPLRAHLARWIFCLAERRINAPVQRAAHWVRYHQPWPVAGAEPTSLAQMLRHALADARAAERWLTPFRERCESSSRLVGQLWQRRAELVRRWGGDDWEAFTGCGISAERVARDWLARSNDLFAEQRHSTLVRLLALAMAHGAQLPWPTHLSWRSLCELFSGSPLLSSLTLRPARLPERVGPASFLRGLAGLGEQWAQALAPADQFFVVANEPFRLHVHTHAALFGLLPCDTSFLKRQLAASPGQIESARRALHTSVLIESRVRAFKVLVGRAALQGRAAFEETFVGEAERCLGVGLPPSMAGALFMPDVEDAQRLIGLLLACDRTDGLVRAHDEDWFRNPRAVDQLQSEAALPPLATAELQSVGRGSQLLADRLTAGLS